MKTKQALAIGFTLLSLILFAIHYLIFKDFHHIAIYTLHDIAFLPFEVLIVSFVLEEIISWVNEREKKEKTNMIISSFFSEVGNHLLSGLAKGLNEDFKKRFQKENLENVLQLPEKKYGEFKEHLQPPEKLELDRNHLLYLKTLLEEKRRFLIELLNSPSLTEHTSFSSLVFSLVHLSDELSYRPDLLTIPDSDLEHLQNDALRVFRNLLIEWLNYLRFTKEKYPYLFSLAVRTNPFTAELKVEVS